MRSKFPEGARVGLPMLDVACWSQWMFVLCLSWELLEREQVEHVGHLLFWRLSLGAFYDNAVVGYGASSFHP